MLFYTMDYAIDLSKLTKWDDVPDAQVRTLYNVTCASPHLCAGVPRVCKMRSQSTRELMPVVTRRMSNDGGEAASPTLPTPWFVEVHLVREMPTAS